MPLIKSKSKKAMSKNIEAEMDAGKPQKQAVAIAYSIARRARKRKMAQGGLVHPEDEKDLMESKISEHFPTYDTRQQEDPEGYDSTQDPVEEPKKNKPNISFEDASLQERMVKRPSDKQDRSNVLFDGKAERIDPLKLEMRENLQSDHLGRRDLDEEDSDADDIVSRIMRKMRRR